MANLKLDKMELDEFNGMVDEIIDDLEKGRISKKDVTKPSEDKPIVEEITVEDTAVETNDIELGEDALIESAKKEESKIEKSEIIGKPSKKLVVVTDKEGKETIYGNAAICASEISLNPTTIRTRCSGEKVDAEGNLWSYRDNI